jgi:hypothetical protein
VQFFQWALHIVIQFNQFYFDLQSIKQKIHLALGEIALGEIALGEIALGEIALGKTALGEIALGKTALGEIALGETALGESSYVCT